MTKRYLEDFAAGQTFGSGRVRVDRERIKTFAAGVGELRWPLPVRPGDELCVESEILEVRRSKSHPQQGLIKAADDDAEPGW